MEVNAEHRALVVSYDFLYVMGEPVAADARHEAAHDAESVATGFNPARTCSCSRA